MLSPVDLNRRFREWNEKEPPDPEMLSAFGLEDGVGWDELLKKRRVVVLAEAGSGKTTEFKERVKLLRQPPSNAFAFYASVEDVGREGLDSALSVADRNELATWRGTTNEGWFFIDSVDEAKASGIKLERVVRKLAEGLYGAENRCHIVLSGRMTDWESRRDVETLNSLLPVPRAIAQPEPSKDEELLAMIRNGRKQSQEPSSTEAPFVVVMAPLDRPRVRLFAEALRTPQIDPFLKAIDDANLWRFARRPLDLEWLVRFWQVEGRLGTLQEMAERCIRERLKESNTYRARNDDLAEDAALRAVERIGAAMVFGRVRTIAVPDSDMRAPSESSLEIADILPDWSGEDRARLLTRAIFDPATLGRVRFHNDNDGTVRSFLAARWLARLRKDNLRTTELLRLLFARSYGLDVVRPSLNETTAWLCLWDKDVANESLRIAPALLLGAGDPASLPESVRSAALVATLKEMANADQESPWLDNDKLRRFAQPELSHVIQLVWPAYRNHGEAAQLLMRLIWLGALQGCCPLARDVAFDEAAEPRLRALAGKALLATADPATREDYAALIRARSETLPVGMVSDAIVELFPTQITISDLLCVLGEANLNDDENGLGFGWNGSILVRKLQLHDDLTVLLQGLLARLDGELGDHAHHPTTKCEQVIFPAMAEAAHLLLKTSSSDGAPVVAIDAILRMVNRADHGTSVRPKLNEALTELHRTVARRRQAFWRVVDMLRAAVPSRRIACLWDVEYFGYSVSLGIEDVQWLLSDGLERRGEDCCLAVRNAMGIYGSAGEPSSLLSEIREAVGTDPVGLEAIQEWIKGREAGARITRERCETQNQNEARRDDRDQQWIRFIHALRSDPERIARLRRPVSHVQRIELMRLWELLDSSGGRSQYSIDNVAPLASVAGLEVAEAVKAGLIAHWRECEPLIRSRRTLQDRDSVRWFDLMGLTGVALEAASDSAWATKLSADESRRAAEFATIEINGFPRWLSDLVASHPAEVKAVLLREIRDELTRQDVGSLDTLPAVGNSKGGLASLLAPELLQDLEARIPVPQKALGRLLEVIVSGLSLQDRDRFEKLGISRFQKEPDPAVAVPYLVAVFSINPRVATDALLARAAALNDGPQLAVVDRFLTACFGNWGSGTTFRPISDPPPDVIEDLTLLSFKTHEHVIARRRRPGIAYQLGDADYADEARSALFKRFARTPGSATYHTLRRLQHDPAFPVSSLRLRRLAEERAAEDSEFAGWPPREVFEFEKTHETSPRTAQELRSVLLGRLEDIQHDLLHDDFSQASTFRGLEPESEVQKWVADRLRLKQGRSFSVEREPHVVEEKEPDIRIRAKATDASVSIEIKVAETWPLSKLDDALEVQLCGRYLRSADGSYGVLLLVHQEPRVKGWEDKAAGKYLSFRDVVERLRGRALAISGESHHAPQPEVAVLDVSGC